MYVALAVAGLGCVAIIAIGVRFLLTPMRATLDFGVQPDQFRALTQIKGVRDMVSGIAGLVVWATGTPRTLGWLMLAQTLTPLGDAVIVLRNGGTLRHALGVHATTAAVMVGAGIALLLAT